MAINPFRVRNGLIVGEAATSNVIAEFKSTDAIFIPTGTTAQRPASPAEGYFRYNTELDQFEGFQASAWGSIGGGANVQALATAPTSPNLGDLWFHTTEEILYAYVNNGVEDVWLDVTTDPFGPEFTASGTAPVSPAYNDLWFDTTDDILSVYVNDGNQDVWIDILTAGSIADGYVAVTDQTFTNSESAIARNNMSAAHLTAMASQTVTINGFGERASIHGDLSYANTDGHTVLDLWRAFFAGGHDVNTYSTSSIIPHSSINRSGAFQIKVANAAPSTTSYMSLAQRIEGECMRRLGWGTTEALPATVGFWARASSPCTFASNLRDSGLTRSYIKSHTVAGNTWTYFTYNLDGPTDGTWYTNTSIGCYMGITIACGSTLQNSITGSWISDNALAPSGISNFGSFAVGNTFNVTGLYLLPGTHQISEEDALYLQQPPDVTQTKVERYFQVLENHGVGVAPGSLSEVYRTNFSLMTRMRAAPTITVTDTLRWYDGAGDLIYNAITISAASNSHVEFNANLASGNTAAAAGRACVLYGDGSLELNALL